MTKRVLRKQVSEKMKIYFMGVLFIVLTIGIINAVSYTHLGGKTGAAIAWQATTFNYLTNEQKKQKEALIGQALEEGDEEQANTCLLYTSRCV